jgi:hypothetical protein
MEEEGLLEGLGEEEDGWKGTQEGACSKLQS